MNAESAVDDIAISAIFFSSFSGAVSFAKRAAPAAIHGWLLFLAAQNLQRTTTLLEEMRRMATNDDQLTAAVQDLLDAFTTNTAAIEAEISAMQTKGLDGADPVITAAVSNIENIVAKMKQSTSAAQAAIAPPASGTTPVPSQASASGSAGAAAGASSSAAAGTTDAAATTSTPAAGNSSPAGSSSSGAGGAGDAGTAATTS